MLFRGGKEIRNKEKITQSKRAQGDGFVGIIYKGRPYDFAVNSLGIFSETNRLRYALNIQIRGRAINEALPSPIPPLWSHACSEPPPRAITPLPPLPTSNRVWALDVVTSSWFDRTILFFIGLNSAFLALTDYEHIDSDGEPVSDTAPLVSGNPPTLSPPLTPPLPSPD